MASPTSRRPSGDGRECGGMRRLRVGADVARIFPSLPFRVCHAAVSIRGCGSIPTAQTHISKECRFDSCHGHEQD